MSVAIIIPARLNSSRLPNKVLLDLNGKTILQRVFERCVQSSVGSVYIATDSDKIEETCKNFTSNILKTCSSHASGTDRIAEAIKKIRCDAVINVQGDEPFIEPKLIQKIANTLEAEAAQMVSAMRRITVAEDLKNPNIVKVSVDKYNNALYFSRSIIPYNREDNLTGLDKNSDSVVRYYSHIGIYGYRKKFLLHFTGMKKGYLESVEKLEQLRALENGFPIKMVETTFNGFGIDTKEDYKKAKEIIYDF